MNKELTVMRTMSEYGSLVTVVIFGGDDMPISDRQLAEALQCYAEILLDPDTEEMPN